MTPDQTLDALLSLPGLWGAQVSPDGRWAAWAWYRTGPAADVYAAPTDASAPPARLTETPDDTLLVSWTPDSRAVIVEQDHDGNERAQLFRVDIARPGEMIPLTEPAPGYFLRGGQLTPNGRYLIYGANYDFAAGQEIEPTWVYRHDLRTGQRLPLARPEKGCWYFPKLNPQGTHVLYSRKDLHPSGMQVWLADVERRADCEVLNAGEQRKAYAAWFPDGRRAIVWAEAGDHRRVGVWDRETGDLRWLLDDPARNPEGAYVPFGSDRAVIVERQAARVRASLLDPQTGAETRLPPLPGNLTPLAPDCRYRGLAPVGEGRGDPAGRPYWVGEYASSRQPADLVRFRPDDPRPETFVSLTRIWERTPLTAADLAPAQDFRWRSPDGLEVQGWLYRARGPARGAVVYIHGGPTAHSEDRLNPQIQCLVSQGFDVLDPNYRGSTGFGLAYMNAIKEDGWGGREQDDIRAGIEALIAAGIAQPGRVGVTGTSYGGYSSWYQITHCPPELVAASAPICGMTDLVVDYQTTRHDLRPYSEEMMGGRPDQVPERYRERSPLHFVGNIRGRLLIVQGMTDPNVTPENARVVKGALDAAGVEFQLLAFEDEGHGIQRPKNLKTLYLRLAEFFGEAFGAWTRP